MAYVLYKNGNIEKKQTELPKSWGNISGFNNAPIDMINENNWYEFKKSDYILKDYEKINGFSYNLVSNIVIETANVENIDLETYKLKKINKFKSLCEEEILQEYPLYKQININRLADGYSQEDLDAMTVFIDTRREKSNLLESQVNLSKTLDEVSLINW